MRVKVKKFTCHSALYLAPSDEPSEALFSHIIHDTSIADLPKNRERLTTLAKLHGENVYITEYSE
jgi:hypothetical protein